jgi:hypothetical protein
MKIRTTEKCKVCGGTYYAKGLCKFHYERQRRGNDLNMAMLTKENEVEILGDVAKVYYQNKDRVTVGHFLIDKEDVEKIKGYKWSVMNTGYIAAYRGGKAILLHRFITDCPKGKEVDHINHDRTDNRKINLRICTRRQNCLNKPIDSNTGEYGITLTKKGYYLVQVDGKYCGIAKDFNKALALRDENLKGTEVQEYNFYLA